MCFQYKEYDASSGELVKPNRERQSHHVFDTEAATIKRPRKMDCDQTALSAKEKAAKEDRLERMRAESNLSSVPLKRVQ